MIDIKAEQHEKTADHNAGVLVDAKVKGRYSTIVHELSSAVASVILQCAQDDDGTTNIVRSVEVLKDINEHIIEATLQMVFDEVTPDGNCRSEQSTRINSQAIEEALRRLKEALDDDK